MDKVDLEALDQLHAAATTGKWSVEVEEYGASGLVSIPEINRNLHDTNWADPHDYERDQANAEAIAALHNAYPAIAAELRALRERVASLYTGMRRVVVAAGGVAEDGVSDTFLLGAADEVSALRQERDTLRAESERLREALENLIGNCQTGPNFALSKPQREWIIAGQSALSSTPATAEWLAARDAEMKRIGAAELDAANAEIARLRAELAAAREDSARLDAAQQAGWTIGPLDAIKPRVHGL